jgi:hypothetical protein
MADHIVICGHDGSHNRRLTCSGAGNLLVEDVTSHSVLSNIDTELEGLTTLLTAANVNTAHLSDDLDGLSTNQGVIYTELGNHGTLLTAANVNTAHLSDNLDTLSTNLNTINTSISNVDAVLEAQSILLTTSNTNTAHLSDNLDSIVTNTTGLNGCVAGTELQVDVLTLPAVTGTFDLGATDNAVLDSIATNTAHLSDNLDTLSAQLPTTLGAQTTPNSLSVCRTTTVGAYDMAARTTIATASSTTKLLCDADGHLQVDVLSGGGGSPTDVSALATHAKQDTLITHLSEIEGATETIEACVASNRLKVNNNTPFGSVVSLASAQAISGTSTWISPEIANNAGDKYTIQFTNSIDDSISYSILGSMTSGGTTYSLPYLGFNENGSPESGIAGLAVVDGVYTPYFKIVATNTNISTQSTTLDYIKW